MWSGRRWEVSARGDQQQPHARAASHFSVNSRLTHRHAALLQLYSNKQGQQRCCTSAAAEWTACVCVCVQCEVSIHPPMMWFLFECCTRWWCFSGVGCSQTRPSVRVLGDEGEEEEALPSCMYVSCICDITSKQRQSLKHTQYWTEREREREWVIKKTKWQHWQVKTFI